MEKKSVLHKISSSYIPAKDLLTELVENFLSEDFKLTKQNIIKFFQKLHDTDYQCLFNKLTTIKVNNISARGCFSFKDPRNCEISFSQLYFNSDLTNKIDLLATYFHENRHEAQSDNFAISFVQSQGIIQDVINFEITTDCETYFHFMNLSEIDARFYSVSRMVALLKKIKTPKKIEIFLPLIDEVMGVVSAIDFKENVPELQDKVNEILDSNITDIVDFWEKLYKNKTTQMGVTIFNSEAFKLKFSKTFYRKLRKFLYEDFKYIFDEIIKIYEPSLNAFNFDWNNKVLTDDLYEQIAIIDFIFKDCISQFEASEPILISKLEDNESQARKTKQLKIDISKHFNKNKTPKIEK